MEAPYEYCPTKCGNLTLRYLAEELLLGGRKGLLSLLEFTDLLLFLLLLNGKSCAASYIARIVCCLSIFPLPRSFVL